MKKFTFSLLLGILVFAGANTASAVCITLGTGEFCDQIEVTQVGDLVVGLWDWNCGDDPVTTIIGQNTNKLNLVTRPFFTDGSPEPRTLQFVFNKATNTFDLYQTDDGTSITQILFGAPFSHSSGSCAFTALDPNKKPSSSRDR
jgi:hypothetical protein